MSVTRYRLDPDDSRLIIHASSSLHPINTEADGVQGEIELALAPDGSIDVDAGVAGSVQFELSRLSAGNPLYDRETERRIDVRHFPVVEATMTSIALIGDADPGEDPSAPGSRYRVAGELTFHGVTRALEDELVVRVIHDETGATVVQISGEHTIDVREWDITPPRFGLLKVHPDVRVRLEATARPTTPS